MPEPAIIRSDGTKDIGRVTRAGEDWSLELSPCDLTYLRVNHQARLQLGEAEVVIEGAFRVQEGDLELTLDPGDRRALSPFLGLYPNTLVDASVDAEATLRLSFSSGAIVTVPSDPHYEAWQVSEPAPLWSCACQAPPVSLLSGSSAHETALDQASIRQCPLSSCQSCNRPVMSGQRSNAATTMS